MLVPVAAWQLCELLYTCYLVTYLPAIKPETTMGVNSLLWETETVQGEKSKTVSRQRRGCDLNPEQ